VTNSFSLVYNWIEITSGSWFILELLVRIFVAPSLIEHLKTPLNWIDMLTAVPFILFFIALVVPSADSIRNFLKVFRVLLILKLMRHSSKLRSLGYVLETSASELVILVMYLSFGVLIFSSLIFFCEYQEPGTLFVSIPGRLFFLNFRFIKKKTFYF
jgi:hypothetical protein